MTPTLEQVLEVVPFDAAVTVDEAARLACGRDAWAQRTNVRNRLYQLTDLGAIICDEGRPMRFTRNQLR